MSKTTGRTEVVKNYLDNQNVSSTSERVHPLQHGIDISIVVPVFNEESYLPHLLDSLTKQKHRNFEVLVINNGSSDNTEGVIKLYRKRVFFDLHLITEPVPGIGNARKKGMDKVVKRAMDRDGAKTKHIILLTDADTTLQESWTKNVITRFAPLVSGALAGTHGVVPILDSYIEKKLSIKDYFNKIPAIIEWLQNKHIGIIKMNGPNSAFEIEAYCAGGGMQQQMDIVNGNTVEGTSALGFRLSKKGYPILPMNCRVFSSRRRHLTELLKGKSVYRSDTKYNRITTIRSNELVLLRQALDDVPLHKWLDYQFQTLEGVLSEVIFKPSLQKRRYINSLQNIFSPETYQKYCEEIMAEAKNVGMSESFTSRWTTEIIKTHDQIA